MLRRLAIVLAFALLLVLTGSCGSGDGRPELTVFAASSLTDAFEQIGEDFGAADVTFNFAGSQELRAQLEQGARADVFASADRTQMEMAQAASVVAEDSFVFARNRLVIIVPKSNKAGIESPQDLAEGGVKVVIAGEGVPVGKYALSFLEKASADAAYDPGYDDAVLGNVVSEETNVRQVAVKVQLGEADAGIVYQTDVHGDLADDVKIIEIPDDLNQTAEYPLALASEPDTAKAAQDFIDFVLSEAGQDILEEHGFIRVDR
jgi:molybdate transport system substrate-binding protein